MALRTGLIAALVAAAMLLPAPGRADILEDFAKSVARSGAPTIAGEEDARNIPAHAEEGVMGPPQGRLVVMDDEVRRLAPGAKIRDFNNRIVMPHTITEAVNVRYTTDQYAHVHLIWLVPEKEEEEKDGNKEAGSGDGSQN